MIISSIFSCIIPSFLTELNDNVAFPDGVKFYPDVQNGVRGYNTDPQRGADTFCPFKGGEMLEYTLSSAGGSIIFPEKYQCRTFVGLKSFSYNNTNSGVGTFAITFDYTTRNLNGLSRSGQSCSATALYQ